MENNYHFYIFQKIKQKMENYFKKINKTQMGINFSKSKTQMKTNCKYFFLKIKNRIIKQKNESQTSKTIATKSNLAVSNKNLEQ